MSSPWFVAYERASATYSRANIKINGRFAATIQIEIYPRVFAQEGNVPELFPPHLL
jgi:hypothetical protein